MKCINCGHEINDNSSFCKVCGAKIKDNSDVMTSEPEVEQQPYYPDQSIKAVSNKGTETKWKYIAISAVAVCVAVLAVSSVFLIMSKSDDNIQREDSSSNVHNKAAVTSEQVHKSEETASDDTEKLLDEIYKNVEVPNFVGINIDSVKQNYEGTLKFEIKNEYNSQYDEGIIIEQSIEPGVTVERGTVIKFTVSKGEQMAVIPDVAGSTQDAAKSELEAKGFIVIIRKTYDDNIAQGLAVKTQPEAGSNYPVGKEVTLFVSQGTLDTVKVPNVIGLTEEKAVAKLKENNLVPNVQTIEHEGEQGKVLDQDIEAGKKVDRDTEVTIYVAVGSARSS